MELEEYNCICLECDRPIRYRRLGRSIIVPPCQGQMAELVETIGRFIEHAEAKTFTNRNLIALALGQFKVALPNIIKK